MKKTDNYISLLNSLTKSVPRLPGKSYSPKMNQSDSLPKIKYGRNSPRIQSQGEEIKIPEIENTVASKKQCGYVIRYSVNTLPGLVRKFNEDRVSIILNIPCPVNFSAENWPRSSFYGIYDGHGGKLCANFLKENLHTYIFSNPNFPMQPKKALFEGFLKAEEEFLKLAKEKNDTSGSCAVVVLIIGDKCYTANTGDSRARMSAELGEKVIPLTVDHKPNESNEYDRIIQAGGSIITHSYPIINSHGAKIGANCSRVVPGNLAVSRTIGDIEVKNHKIVIPDPDVRSFRLKEEYDFIVIASDGIYDELSDKEVIDVAWAGIKNKRNIQDKIVAAVEEILKQAFIRETEDNVSVIFVALKGIKEVLNQ